MKPLEHGSAKSLNWADRPAPELVRLAWPIAVSNLSYAAMGLADTLFVSELGSAPLAGVGLGGILSMGLMAFGCGLYRGVKILTSQSAGAGRLQDARRFVGAGMISALWLGAVMILLGRLVGVWAGQLSASPEAGAAACVYIHVRTLGAPLLFVYVALREARYGRSDSRAPMVAALAGNVLNIALDYVALFVLDMGVAGAALATVIAFGVSAALLVRAQWADGFGIDRLGFAAQREVFRAGLPTGLQFVLDIAAFAVISAVLAGLSDADIAAHQIALHVTSVAFLPALALAEASTVLVGKAVGANRDELVPRVARAALLMGVAYATVCAWALLGLGAGIVNLFSPDARLLEVGVKVLVVGAFMQWFDATCTVGHGVLRGAGDQRFSAAAAVLCAWACTPTLGFWFARSLGWGAVGGWVALSVEMVIGTFVVWHRIQLKGWVRSAEQARRELAIAHA